MATARVISADSHMMEPPNLWVERVDDRLKDRAPRVIEQGNVIENVQFIPAAGAGVAAPAAGAAGTVRLNLRTETPIPVGNELPTMFIGSVGCDGSYVSGSTQRMVFECPAEDLSSAEGQPIKVRGNTRTIWNFGNFSNAMVH